MAHLVTIFLILVGAIAGFVSDRLGLPLPYLLGPLLVSGALATLVPHRLPEGYQFPPLLRLIFIAVIGLMIGAQVTPDLFESAGRLALSFGALMLFVALCLGYNYLVFRRIGNYDPVTAFYCSSPGGLFESLAMGEAAGGDITRLTMQQFLRIILVVTLLPIGLSFALGAPVGSAAGMTFARSDVIWSDLPLICLAGVVGSWGGRKLRLPAGQLTGPMAVAACLSLSGLFQIDMPDLLVKVAQVVVGVALGMRFTGLSRGLLFKGAGLSLISVSGMLVLSALFAFALMPLTGEAFDVLLISFAPGGVTEMALVALSLQANPAFVTLHHIIRIVLTVLGLVATDRFARRRL